LGFRSQQSSTDSAREIEDPRKRRALG